MALPTFCNVATPTLAGIIVALGEYSGINRTVSRKIFRWMLSCSYQAPHNRRPRIAHASRPSRRLSSWRIVGALENILTHLKEKTTNAVKKIQNPYDGLILDEENQDALDVIVNCCTVPRPVPFWIGLPFWKQAPVRKVAEGSYGEIYSTVNSFKEPRILKFVPMHSQLPDRDFNYLSFTHMLPDVICSKYLSKLNEGEEFKAPNFPILHSLKLIKGKYPIALINAWRHYEINCDRDEEQSSPGHIDPVLYEDGQFYVLIEMQDCGVPISQPLPSDIMSSLSSICQAISALAVAEKALNFEHRDLHLGNILLKRTHLKTLEYIIDGQPFEVLTCGFHLFIIDFTLSRITVDGKIYRAEMDRPDDPIHISDIGPDFEWTNHNLLYRLLPTVCNDDWATFNPKTNILWLQHVVETLWRNLCIRMNGRVAEERRPVLKILQRWRDHLLKCASAAEFFQKFLLDQCPFVKSK